MQSLDYPDQGAAPTGRTATVFGLLGLGLIALGIWGLVTDVVWVSQAFYAYIWWGWILLLDAYCIHKRRSSLLTTRRHLLALLGTSSVTFWFLFEALNIRFSNWYYIGTFELDGPMTYVTAGLFVFAAFSTVFVGMFEAFDALGAAGIFTKRGTPSKLPAWLPAGLQVLGLTMAILAVAFPFYLAPLIWGSLTFLIDPWNYKRGNRSLLRDFEAGDGGAVARLFLAGLISGIVWESMNFVAPQKWIYTVRGLESLKLFEMPLLGFLGFPALAFDAVTFFSLMSYFLCGNIAWEHSRDLAAPALPVANPSCRAFWRTLPVQVLFCIVVTIAMMPSSIGSIRLRIARVPSASAHVEGLAEAGIEWPRQLLQRLEDPGARGLLMADLGWTEAQAAGIQDEVELFLFKGIGSYYGYLLQKADICRIEDLEHWEPEGLFDELSAIAIPLGMRGPRQDWVRVWVLAARSRGLFVNTR